MERDARPESRALVRQGGQVACSRDDLQQAQAGSFDIADIIEGFVPGWSRGSDVDATRHVETGPPVQVEHFLQRGPAVASTPGVGTLVICRQEDQPVRRRSEDAEEESFPARPVVEVQGIVPDWLCQAGSFLTEAPSAALKSIAFPSERPLPAIMGEPAAGNSAHGHFAESSCPSSRDITPASSSRAGEKGRVALSLVSRMRCHVQLSLVDMATLSSRTNERARICSKLQSCARNFQERAFSFLFGKPRIKTRPAQRRQQRVPCLWLCCKTASTAVEMVKRSRGFVNSGRAAARPAAADMSAHVARASSAHQLGVLRQGRSQGLPAPLPCCLEHQTHELCLPTHARRRSELLPARIKTVLLMHERGEYSARAD